MSANKAKALASLSFYACSKEPLLIAGMLAFRSYKSAILSNVKRKKSTYCLLEGIQLILCLKTSLKGGAKRKRVMRKMHRFRFIARMRKVLSGLWLSTDTFYSIRCFCWQTAKTLVRLRSCSKTRFRMARPILPNIQLTGKHLT